MDTCELIHVVRESYPFPIAHAHKKTLGVLENEEKKLTCLFQTAETTIQFLALLALAQVRQDILSRKPVPNLAKLREKLNLATPSLGKWSTMARETMKAYWNTREQLAVPELFDLFWSWDAARQKIGSKPINNTAIAPLIELRNNFHHGRIQSHQIPDLLPTALDQLHQFLAAIRFVAEYQLVFTNRILLDQEQDDAYLNELMLFTGCFSAFDTDRWKSAIRLKPDAVVFLHPQTGRHLVLSPFINFTNQFNGLPDLLVINSLSAKEAEYVATLFGNVAKTSQPDWAEGAKYFAALNEFVKQLQQAADAAAPADLPPEEAAPAPIEDDAPIMRKAAVPPAATHTQHASPYKFLDYYNPEDADIFFGRDREIRVIEQKFHNTRLLVLHGESGTGKTSLIRAGLMPRLSPEVFVPVYVRVLRDPLREIKRELLRQLGLQDESLLDKPLPDFLTVAAERVSKTVIIVFDQFEEFFLRFDDEARRRVIAELAACLTETRLDVKFLLAIRSDYFALLAAFEEAIPQIFTHQIHLERLTEAQAVEAVIKPAERLGIQVDEPMVQIKLLPELLAKDGGIEPPLLQIVCDALYQHAQNDGRTVVDMRDYEAVGDVTGALGNYLHEKLRQFGTHQAAARAALKALVTAEGTKRASFVPELCSRIISAGQRITEEELRRDYLDKFVRDRLVRVEDVEGQACYELSHDYLAKHVEAWIEENERELTKALELIDRAYETYQATRVLLERSALQALKPFEAQLALPPEKQVFLDRSKTETRKQRRGLWLKVAAALMAMALIVGGGFGYQLLQSYQETQAQRDRALNEEQKANAARQRAEQQKELALKAISSMTYEFADELAKLPGTVAILKRTFESNTKLLDQIYKLDPQTPRVQREKAVNLTKMGEVWQLLGKTDKALTAYQQSFDIRQKLAQTELENEDTQYDLSVGYSNIGDIQMRLGYTQAALTAYQQSFEINQRLAQADPTNAKAKHYLAISYNFLGDVQLKLGNTQVALDMYKRYSAILQQIAQIDLTDTTVQNNLSLSYSKIGNIYLQLDNSAGALAAYQKSFEIDQRLVQADMANIQMQRNLSFSYIKIGNAQIQLGDTIAALTAYQQSLTIRERLAQADPANAEAQDDLLIAYAKMADIELKKNANEKALEWYQKALLIAERLVTQDSTNIRVQYNLAWLQNAIGEILFQQKKFDEAIKMFHQIIKMKPNDAEVWYNLGNAFLEQQNWEEAITAFRKLIEIKPNIVDAWRYLGYALWKQGKLEEAANAHAEGLKANPKNIDLLSNDAELALVQGDSERCQIRIAAALPLVKSDDQLFAILPFYQWLSNRAQGWNQVLTAIEQLDPAVKFTWSFDTTKPALERLDAKTQKAAQEFIAFFEGKIDLPTLKARLEGR